MSRFVLHLLLCLALACNGLAGGCAMTHAEGAIVGDPAAAADAGHRHAHTDAVPSTPAEHHHGTATDTNSPDSSRDCCNSAACGCMSASTGALAGVMLMPHAATSSPGLAAAPEVAIIPTSSPFRLPTV